MSTFYLVAPLIGVSIGVVLILLVILQRRRSPLHRVFSLFLASMTLWSLTVFGMRISPLEQALPWEMAIFAVLPFVSVSYYHSVLLLSHASKSKGWLLATYGFAFIAICLIPTRLIVSEMKPMWYGNGFIAGPLFYPYIVVFYGFVILGILELMRAYRSSASPVEKNRYIYVAVGAFFCLLGLLMDALAAQCLRIYPMGVISNVIFLLLCSYAILKYQLFDVQLVMRRSVVYFVVTAISVGLVVALLYLFYELGLAGRQLLDWKTVVFIIVIVALLQYIIRWLQNRLDRLFHRSKYDYLRAMENLSDNTKAITDLNFIVTALRETVTNTIKPKNIMLLLPDREEKHFVPDYSIEKGEYISARMPYDGVLVSWLRNEANIMTRREMEVAPQFQALTIHEREFLTELEVELIVPLHIRNNLTGILALSRKLSDQDYSPEEMPILRIMASQMATTLDNARLFGLERKARDDLQREFKERTEFVDALVHEVKTPLTAMLASSELLKDELAPNGSVLGELATNMDNAVHNLNRRISELVQFTKLQRTEIALNLENIDINKVIREAVSQTERLLANKKQTVRLEIQPSLGPIRCDRDRLLQILLNLLTNAAKYGPAGDSLLLKAYRLNNNAIIEICDSAPPLTQQEMELAFTPYQQGRRKGSGGLGLGLYICKQLVELHGGEMWLETKTTGNQFKFSLPLANQEVEDESFAN